MQNMRFIWGGVTGTLKIFKLLFCAVVVGFILIVHLCE